MCGVAGVLGLGAELRSEDRENLRKMTALLKHRGPDHTGFMEESRCAFGNSRLSIIDLTDAASLPMANSDNSVIIAYNGEVTNFQELRTRFRLDDKYEFRSSSDSEVVLRLYEELGIQCCRHLSGMFAFSIYDRRIEKAFIVRDFYGIRPLFIMRNGDRLYFASEIKAFLDLPRFKKNIDLEGLFHYFTLSYIPGRHTPFKGIEEVPGGTWLEVDLREGIVDERKYYRPSYNSVSGVSEADLATSVYEHMRDSVRRNLVSDAPVGVTLSGGFDTSSILALARELEPERELHTYSIVMEEPSFDESKHQRTMVEFAKTTHHEIRVGPGEVLGALKKHMAFMDEPSGNGASIPSYLLAQEAAKDVKVLLSGEGGDETFTAYETYRAWKVRKYYRKFTPSLLRKTASFVAHSLPVNYTKLSFDFLAKRFTEGAEMTVPESHVHWRYTLNDSDKRKLMPGSHDFSTTGGLFGEIYEGYDYEHELDRLSALDLETYFIGDLMVKNDRTMMAHSVEARFPYMDRILFDFVSGIHAEKRLKGLQGRYMQKLAMRGRVPESIFRRKNMGLEMPHSKWFLEDWRGLGEEYFSKRNVDKVEFLDHRTVSRLWQEHVELKKDHGRALWSILNLLVWFDLFVYDNDYKRYL
jgi:asparagine synthase (glutamine-hydrolysing)